MADDACLVFFRSGRGDLDTAAAALADRGMTIDRAATAIGDELTVGYSDGPQLRIVFSRESHVREEAAEIGEGTLHAAAMAECDVRYEIMIDTLDAVLDEINTLIEVQITLGNATGGFLFNTWNGELSGPGDLDR